MSTDGVLIWYSTRRPSATLCAAVVSITHPWPTEQTVAFMIRLYRHGQVGGAADPRNCRSSGTWATPRRITSAADFEGDFAGRRISHDAVAAP